MGISRLVLVGGAGLDPRRVQTLAIHALDIYEKREQFETLEEALRSSVFTAGVTRRRGRFRKYFSLLPEEAAEKIRAVGKGDVSLVFGNERTGLTDQELACCDAAVHIPSSPEFPSLNLSHAVQILTYTLFLKAKAHQGKYTPVTRAELDEVTNHMADCLESIGFFSLTGKDDMKRYFRDILSRAALDPREAGRMKDIFTKIAGLKQHGQIEKSSL